MKNKALSVLIAIAFILFSCNPEEKSILIVTNNVDGPVNNWPQEFIQQIENKINKKNAKIVPLAHLELSESYLINTHTLVLAGVNGDQFNHYQQAEIERYVQAGGTIVGINAVSPTDRNWLWYSRLVGATYSNSLDSLPKNGIISDNNSPIIKGLVDKWNTNTEWPIVKLKDGSQEISRLSNENSQQGIPICWKNSYDGGNGIQFNIAPSNMKEPFILDQILNALAYTINQEVQLDYSKVNTKQIPAENRFIKTAIKTNLYEPMELAVLPNGNVLVIERRGGIFQYVPATESYDTIVHFPVHTEFEDGLMGLAADPNFEENHWIYLFYSPIGNIPKQHLSRFVFKNNQLDLDSEVVILEVATQRDECCHSGGSLAFDHSGNLFLSTGDDTNPFASDGFAPIDERPGRSAWDAQRSSGNTNDLRGKILRIHPEPDGTYTIPKGNLFPEGTPKTRPEIFAMGCRNPFRISIDQKTGHLYWGDVGPDSGKNNANRGPKGYDGINRATAAGFWGWPYIRGNRTPYFDYDFKQEKSGSIFDPDHLINDSPNNTGLSELPPVNPYFIWYSYDESLEFPWTGKGGKNPMAGPLYHSDEHEGPNKFPDYFDNKLFVYEWMRHWVYIITIDEKGNYVKADPFMPNNEFSRPMDMAFNKEGSLYILEYGPKWNAQNEEAQLIRIDYQSGNRAPIANLEVANKYGGVPFTTTFYAKNSMDYDADQLKYQWEVDGQKIPEPEATLNYTFDKAGAHIVKLTVLDQENAQSTDSLTVFAGNNAPVVQWSIDGNSSFFWPGRKLDYEVVISDQEDGNEIEDQAVSIAFDYLALGEDITEIAQGHAAQLSNAKVAKGAQLTDQSDCKICHAVDKKINGPSYLEIANFYKGKDVTADLGQKIIKGGGGVWGETVMSAHPDLTKEESEAMAAYILSVSEENSSNTKNWPLDGIYDLDHADETGKYILWASYTDKGGDLVDPITSESSWTLRHPRIQAERYDTLSELPYVYDFNNEKYIRDLKHQDFVGFKNIDLTNVAAITLNVLTRGGSKGSQIMIRTQSPEGPVIGQVDLDYTGELEEKTIRIPLKPTNETTNFYLVFSKPNNENARVVDLNWVEFNLDLIK